MAVFSAVKNKKQTKGAMAGVLNYISDSNKVYYNDIPLRTGLNCNYYSGFAEMCLTKKQYKKDDGRQFYQFVQSFAEEDNVTPLGVHQIGLEFAQKLFPDFEVMVATHCNTKHPHNSPRQGKFAKRVPVKQIRPQPGVAFELNSR